MKPAYDELCQLLESSANLAQSSRETLEPRDFVKVIAPSGAKIVEILEEEEGHNRKIDAFSVDEVMRFIRNFTKPT